VDNEVAPARARPGWTGAASMLCILVVLLAPGTVLGGAVAFALWRWRRPYPASRWGLAGLTAAIAGLIEPAIVWSWPMRLLSGSVLPAPAVLSSVVGKALLGPLVLQTALWIGEQRTIDPEGRSAAGRRSDVAVGMTAAAPVTERAVGPDTVVGAPSPVAPSDPSGYVPHPVGRIRLGTDAGGQPFDLILPTDLRSSVFIPGQPGKGKTTTLARLADGALANDYALIIIDCKGGGLREEAKHLAAAYQRNLVIFSVDEPDSWGYNPCTGDPSDIADKVVGSFSFEGTSRVFGDVALSIVPPIVRGLRSAERPLTLAGLCDALRPGQLTDLALAVHDDDTILRGRLMEIEKAGHPTSAGRAGLHARLHALREGKFGPLFSKTPAIDWDVALATPTVTYIELSTLASPEAVKLLGRVLIQDLKVVAGRRITALAAAARPGETTAVTPALLIIDEFAALGEPAQIQDLLLQGRQAQMPVVISTQVIPTEATLRRATMGSVGLLLVHAVSAEDAGPLAAEFGTRKDTKTGVTVKAQEADPWSVNLQEGRAYNVHPNMLMTLGTGEVYVRATNRDVVLAPRKVAVYKETKHHDTRDQ